MILARAFIALVIGAVSLLAHAQDYPAKPVTVIYPFAAGGPAELPVRLFFERMARTRPNVNLLFEAKPGAGSTLGINAVAKAAPDGYTLLYTGATMSMLGFLYKDLPFDAKRDLVPITTVADYASFIFTNAQTPAKTIEEFVAYAKANSGKLNYGAIARNSTMVVIEAFKAEAGVPLTEVPYPGQAAFMPALLRNDVQLVVGSLGGGTLSQVQAGKIRALMVYGNARSAALPEVPSAKEKGWNLPSWGWLGFFAPRGTPPAIVDWLSSEFVRFAGDAEAQKLVLEKSGARLVGSTPGEFRAQLDNDFRVWEGVAARIGIKPE